MQESVLDCVNMSDDRKKLCCVSRAGGGQRKKEEGKKPTKTLHVMLKTVV